MDFVPPAKQKELRMALEQVDKGIVVVSGPAGCSKTHGVRETARMLGLGVEEMDIELCRGSLAMKNTVCMVDVDDYETFRKHRERLAGMRNVVVETRMLPFVGKLLPNSVTVSMNRVTDARLRRFYGLSEEELKAVDGNLHAVGFCRYSSAGGGVSIYHQLGRIFHSKIARVEDAVRNVDVYGMERFIGYLYENCVFFMGLGDVCRVLDGFSLCSVDEEFLWHAMGGVLRAEKRREGFFGFRAFRPAGDHVCGDLCRNR